MNAQDFATKLPRLRDLALEYIAATGDITAQSKALTDAALIDIPKLGWDAPADLLRLVQRVQASNRVEGIGTVHFDSKGNGPFCVHGGMPMFCRTCDYDAGDTLRGRLVALAKESAGLS